MLIIPADRNSAQFPRGCTSSGFFHSRPPKIGDEVLDAGTLICFPLKTILRLLSARLPTRLEVSLKMIITL